MINVAPYNPGTPHTEMCITMKQLRGDVCKLQYAKKLQEVNYEFEDRLLPT